MSVLWHLYGYVGLITREIWALPFLPRFLGPFAIEAIQLLGTSLRWFLISRINASVLHRRHDICNTIVISDCLFESSAFCWLMGSFSRGSEVRLEVRLGQHFQRFLRGHLYITHEYTVQASATYLRKDDTRIGKHGCYQPVWWGQQSRKYKEGFSAAYLFSWETWGFSGLTGSFKVLKA